MDTTSWRIFESIKGAASVINSGREFVKWVLTGCAAMIGLIIANSDNALPLIGRTNLSIGITFLTLSIVSGFFAMIAANFVEGMLVSITVREKIEGSDEWAKRVTITPFDEELFQAEYGALFSGPPKFLGRLMTMGLKGPSELLEARALGRFLSLFSTFSMVQMAFSFFGILAMIAGMWCS